MQNLITLVFDSGRSAIDVTLYVLLPVMVIMAATMQVLEAKGLLTLTARALSPLLRPLGVPGIGVFAALQVIFVSYAAPLPTLNFMENNSRDVSQRQIAATLAMVLAMSQGNATFPLVAFGLHLWVTVATSCVGGIVAAALAYRLARGVCSQESALASEARGAEERCPPDILGALQCGGGKGLAMVSRAFPILLLAVFAVNALTRGGVIEAVAPVVSPILQACHLPAPALLPLVTKYAAGGSAMVAVVLDRLRDGSLSPLELNRIAGLMINPLDIVGVALLMSVGPRTKSVVRPAVAAGLAGILVRAILHVLMF